MSSPLPNFDIHFTTDKSLPFVLHIHNNSEDATLHPIPESNQKFNGSQKRKRLSRPPEKFDGKQFRIDLLEGNETDKEIAAKKAKAPRNQIDEKFYEEQTNICENYLKEFLKNCKNERVAEMKQKCREAAVGLYEAVEFEDLPLDVPHVAAEQIIKRTKKLKMEYEKVSDLAEKCVNDIVENMFENNGAGSLNAQTLIVGDSMIKKKPEKSEIYPDFSTLTYHGAYRILSYYQLFNPYCFTYPMHFNIPNGFVAHGYHPTEEIFQAIGTSRLGINDLDQISEATEYCFRDSVDEIYVPYLYSYWTNDMQDEITYPKISPLHPTSTPKAATTTTTSTEESDKFETASLPSSSSSKRRRRQKSMSASANLENV